jgi:hypothetical protein
MQTLKMPQRRPVGLSTALQDSPTAFFGAGVVAVLLSEFLSPIEPKQGCDAPNLLLFCHIAPRMDVQGDCRMDLRGRNRLVLA